MANEPKGYLFSQTPEELWASTEKYMRDQGLDPDEVRAKAAANLAAWRALPQEEQDRFNNKSAREWLAWEATVDDMGRTLNLSEEELERRRQQAYAIFDTELKSDTSPSSTG